MKNKTKNTKKQPRWVAIFKETVTLIILLAFFFFLKSNTVELFKIPTGSMEKTLYGANEMGNGFGDHILVLRFAYGLSSKIKIPFINWHIPLPEYRIMLPGMSLPKVGDVVVFENPTDTQIDYIKRCAGTPGDRLKILNGKLYVNDKIVTNSPATANYVYYTNSGLLCDRFVSVNEAVDGIIDYRLVQAARTNINVRNNILQIANKHSGTLNLKKNLLYAINNGKGIISRQFETVKPDIMSVAELYHLDIIKDSIIINGKSYRNVEKQIKKNTAGFNPITDAITSEVVVPENCFFMLGDNSAASADSRFWGFAPLDLIKGRAWCVYLPIKRIRLIR